MTPRDFAAAASWTVVSRIVATASQVALFLIVARLEGPEVIGVFALASAVALGFGLLASAGWREYAAAHADDDGRLAVLNGTAVLAGLTATLASLLVAAVGAAIGAITFAIFLATLSLGMVPQSLGAAFGGRLLGVGRVSALARASILSDLVGVAIAGVVLAAGGGVWSLVSQRLIMLILVAILTAQFLGVRSVKPLARPDRHVVGHASTFLFTAALQWVRQNGLLFLVGAGLGASSVGVFRAGSRLAAAVAELAQEASSRIALSRFGRLSSVDESPAAGSSFTAVVFALTAPLFVGLALIAEPTVALVLGAEWLAAAPVIQGLAIARLLAVQVPGIVPLLMSRRRFRSIILIEVAPTLLAVGGAAAALPFGMAGIVSAVVLANAAFFAIKLYYASANGHHSLGATARMTLRPAVAVLAMAAVVLNVGHDTLAMSLAVKVASGVTAWAFAMALLHPRRTVVFVGARASAILAILSGAPQTSPLPKKRG